MSQKNQKQNCLIITFLIEIKKIFFCQSSTVKKSYVRNEEFFFFQSRLTVSTNDILLSSKERIDEH